MSGRLVTSILVMAASGLISSIANAQPETAKDKFSYAIGFSIAQSLKRDGMDVNIPFLLQAIDDALSGKEVRMTPEDMKNAFDAFQQEQQAARQSVGEAHQKAGTTFLAANRLKPGVTALPSGLQYKVLAEGTGIKPTVSSTVTVHYRGTHLSGEEFDSSIGGDPITFKLDGLIKGWQEALPLMPMGSKWQLFIPSELAYGPTGFGSNIFPNETLIFEIELLAVK